MFSLRFIATTYALILSFFSFNALAQGKESQYIDLPVAPVWTLSQDGNTVSSNSLQGKPYVLHFWATWCPYCKRFQPGLDKVAISFNEHGIDTFAVSFWEEANANPKAEMLNRALQLNVLTEGDDVAKAFNVQGTPTTVFINHKGKVLTRLSTSNPNDPKIRMFYQILLDEYRASL